MPAAHPTRTHSADGLHDRALHHVVYALVVDAIHDGELKPGDHLSEADIAERLGISRSPVREAFTHLAHDGLVERKPRRGTFVAKVQEGDIDQINEVRSLIEGYAARVACSRLTGDDECMLRTILAQMVSSARDRDWIRTVRLNARFHETVVNLSGNSVLSRIWASLDPLVWLIATTVPPGRFHDPDDLVTRHEALIKALRSGDPVIAEDAFRNHISRAAQSNLMGARIDAEENEPVS